MPSNIERTPAAPGDSRQRLWPIGIIRSKLKAVSKAPRQGDEGAPDAWLELRPSLVDGLAGIAVGDTIIIVTCRIGNSSEFRAFRAGPIWRARVRAVCERVGFVAAHNKPKASCGVPESSRRHARPSEVSVGFVPSRDAQSASRDAGGPPASTRPRQESVGFEPRHCPLDGARDTTRPITRRQARQKPSAFCVAEVGTAVASAGLLRP